MCNIYYILGTLRALVSSLSGHIETLKLDDVSNWTQVLKLNSFLIMFIEGLCLFATISQDCFILQAGQFVIEYCGEVISWKEAKRRSQAYEIKGLLRSYRIWNMPLNYLFFWNQFPISVRPAAGVRDAFIISLNASESIDATKKGSLARFINHSWWAIWVEYY